MNRAARAVNFLHMKPSRKSPRSATGLTKLNLATGLAGALALTSGALAQTADATHAMDGATVETHQTTASGVTLNMDAGLSAVALGSTTAASGKTITTLTILRSMAVLAAINYQENADGRRSRSSPSAS